MNTLLVIVPAVGAALAWLSAVVASLQMVKHRAEGVSVAYLLTHGIAFFTGSAFKPEAAPYRRRFVVSAAAFFGCVLLGAAAAALRA